MDIIVHYSLISHVVRLNSFQNQLVILNSISNDYLLCTIIEKLYVCLP